jgi:hypothetical protein
MVMKAKENRERLAEEASYQREYVADQTKLRKRMRNLLISAIQIEEEKNAFRENWVFLIFYLDILPSLREHIAQRRQRLEYIERVT